MFHKSQKGFTLVEMIVYVSLCSILLITISTFLSFLLGARIRSQSISEVNQQGYRAMNLIALTVRNGRSIESPLLGATSSVLTLTTSDPLRNPTVFSVTSGVLKIKEGSGSPVALTNSRISVTGLTFQDLSSASSTERIMRVSFSVSYNNRSGKEEYSFTKAFTESVTLRK